MLRAMMILLVIFAVGFMLAIMYIDMVKKPRGSRFQTTTQIPGKCECAPGTHFGQFVPQCGINWREVEPMPPLSGSCSRILLHDIAELEVENFGKILSPEADEHMRECRHGRRLPGVPAYEGAPYRPAPGTTTGHGIEGPGRMSRMTRDGRKVCPYGHVYEHRDPHCVECGQDYEESW